MFLRIILLLFFLFITANSGSCYDKVSYKIHSTSSNKAYGSIWMEFQGSNDGVTKLFSPVFNAIADISGVSEGKPLKVIKKETTECLDIFPFFCDVFVVNHKPNALVNLHYTISNDVFGAYKDKNSLLFEGKVFLFPSLNRDNELYFSLDYKDSNLSQAKILTSNTVKELREREKFNMATFFSSVFAIASKDLYSSNYKNIFITTLNFPFEGEDDYRKSLNHRNLRELTNDILSKNHDFIKRMLGQIPYSPVMSIVIFKGEDDSNPRFIGLNTGYTNLIFTTIKKKFEAFVGIISHEDMHNLFGKGKEVSVSFGPKTKFNHLWFDEGFTDYYADLLNYRNGIISRDEYLQTLNKVIELHYKFYRFMQLDLIKNPRNTEILVSKLLGSESFRDNYYFAGSIIAADIDSMLRARSNYSLDDLIKNLILGSCAKLPCNINKNDFIVELSNLLQDKDMESIREYVKKYIIDFYPIDLPDFIYEPKARLSYRFIEDGFNLGFDLERSIELRQIYGLDKMSAAYKAGLREGMRFISHRYKIDKKRESLGKITIKTQYKDSPIYSISFEPKGKMMLPYYK